jgi:nitrite reductase/ring-hydroxylating ferredoxin subunit
MELKSKLIFFFIAFSVIFSLASCKKSKYDVIPDVYIDFTINLTDIIFRDLGAITNHVIVTSATNNWGERSAGYANSGIIVYRSTLEQFYAYDRTCPHDLVLDGSIIKVNVDFINAICPKCGTNYSLDTGGTPFSGPGRYPLKNYKTSFLGQYVHVWHSI